MAPEKQSVPTPKTVSSQDQNPTMKVAQESAFAGWSRRAFVAGGVATLVSYKAGSVFAQCDGNSPPATIAGGYCGPDIPGVQRAPQPPDWHIEFDLTRHPLITVGDVIQRRVPRVRPGQPLHGCWGLYSWNCGRMRRNWEGTLDPAGSMRQGWTMEMRDADGNSFVAPINQGPFVGVSAMAGGDSFYSFRPHDLEPAVRVLNVRIRDPQGMIMATGQMEIALVLEDSVTVHWNSTTPPEGSNVAWGDTPSIGITTLISTPGDSPFSRMTPFSTITMRGAIVRRDVTTPEDMTWPGFQYPPGITITRLLTANVALIDLSFAPAGGARGNNGPPDPATARLAWPWFDRTPLGDINDTTVRILQYTVENPGSTPGAPPVLLDTADAFGNPRRIMPHLPSRQFRVVVPASKLRNFLASHASYVNAIGLQADAVYAGAVAAAVSACWYCAGIAALAAGALQLAAAIAFNVAAGQQSNALDPPQPDSRYNTLVPFSTAPPRPIKPVKELENMVEFVYAADRATRVQPAIMDTEGRILGARLAKNGAAMKAQQGNLKDLFAILQQAVSDMKGRVEKAISELDTLPAKMVEQDPNHAKLDTLLAKAGLAPNLADALTKQIDTWAAEGFPTKIRETWKTDAGLSDSDIDVIQTRLQKDPASRKSVVNYQESFRALTGYLEKAASAVLDEAKDFFAAV